MNLMDEDWPRETIFVDQLEAEVLNDLRLISEVDWESGAPSSGLTHLPESRGSISLNGGEVVSWGPWKPSSGLQWSAATRYQPRADIEKDGLYRILFIGTEAQAAGFLAEINTKSDNHQTKKLLKGRDPEDFFDRPIYLGYTTNKIRTRLVNHLRQLSSRFSPYRSFDEERSAQNRHLREMERFFGLATFQGIVSVQFKTPTSSYRNRKLLLRAAEYSHALTEKPLFGFD